MNQSAQGRGIEAVCTRAANDMSAALGGLKSGRASLRKTRWIHEERSTNGWMRRPTGPDKDERDRKEPGRDLAAAGGNGGSNQQPIPVTWVVIEQRSFRETGVKVLPNSVPSHDYHLARCTHAIPATHSSPASPRCACRACAGSRPSRCRKHRCHHQCLLRCRIGACRRNTGL